MGWRAYSPPPCGCGQLTRCFSAVAEPLVCIRVVCMYRRQNQSQQPKTFAKIKKENPAYDLQFGYDDLIDLDQETHDVADDGACYDELKDPDNGANDTYDHPGAVPRRAMPDPYEGLNAETYDLPDAGPALPDRPTPNQYQNVNQETKNPTTAPANVELIHEDHEQNQMAVHQEPNTAPDYP